MGELEESQESTFRNVLEIRARVVTQLYKASPSTCDVIS